MTNVPENPPPADKGLPVQDPNGGPAAQPASSAPFPPAEAAAALPDRPSARTPPPAAHGLPRRGARGVPAASMNAGKFGMMFPGLPRLELNEQRAAQIAATMAEPAMAATGWNTGGAPVEGDNPDISAGYTYIGQFLDHDITFDPSSSLTEQNDKDALRNYRTPRFDLDSLYGGGPDDSPYMYDQAVYGRLLTGQNPAAGGDGVSLEPADLPRTRLGRAVIGDPRNDVHVIIGQLHLAWRSSRSITRSSTPSARNRLSPGGTGRRSSTPSAASAGPTSGSSSTTTCRRSSTRPSTRRGWTRRRAPWP